MIFTLLLTNIISGRRSAFSQFIEDCASRIGFDVWDWFAFLVALISLYVAYVTLKSQRSTEKNTQALLTLDAQLMLFSDLFLKLYTIQMNLLSKSLRQRRAGKAYFEIYEYKELGELGKDVLLSDPVMNFLYTSEVSSSLESHFKSLSKALSSYKQIVGYPNALTLPLQNIHSELFYDNEFQFLLVNRVYTHIEEFNHKYEYLVQQDNGVSLDVMIYDVAKLAEEIRRLVKEIYLLNDKVRKLYSGILTDQVDRIERYKYHYIAGEDSIENYSDVREYLLEAFGIKDETLKSNINRILIHTSSPLDGSGLYEEDIQFEITDLEQAEKAFIKCKNLYGNRYFRAAFRCAETLTDFIIRRKEHTEDGRQKLQDLQSRVCDFVNVFGGCPDETVWEDSYLLTEQWDVFLHRDDCE